MTLRSDLAGRAQQGAAYLGLEDPKRRRPQEAQGCKFCITSEVSRRDKEGLVDMRRDCDVVQLVMGQVSCWQGVCKGPGPYHDAGEQAHTLPAVGVGHHVAVADGEEGDGD